MAQEDLDDVFKEESWPKTCSCCSRLISEEDWERMRYAGIQRGMEEFPDLELRNCSCQSTLAIVVPRDFVKD